MPTIAIESRQRRTAQHNHYVAVHATGKAGQSLLLRIQQTFVGRTSSLVLHGGTDRGPSRRPSSGSGGGSDPPVFPFFEPVERVAGGGHGFLIKTTKAGFSVPQLLNHVEMCGYALQACDGPTMPPARGARMASYFFARHSKAHETLVLEAPRAVMDAGGAGAGAGAAGAGDGEQQ